MNLFASIKREKSRFNTIRSHNKWKQFVLMIKNKTNKQSFLFRIEVEWSSQRRWHVPKLIKTEISLHQWRYLQQRSQIDVKETTLDLVFFYHWSFLVLINFFFLTTLSPFIMIRRKSTFKDKISFFISKKIIRFYREIVSLIRWNIMTNSFSSSTEIIPIKSSLFIDKIWRFLLLDLDDSFNKTKVKRICSELLSFYVFSSLLFFQNKDKKKREYLKLVSILSFFHFVLFPVSPVSPTRWANFLIEFVTFSTKIVW